TIAFLFLRTFIAAWYAGVDAASADRLIARNKISITFDLPLSYVDKVRNLPGVSDVGYENWFGGYYKDEREFFANFAADDHVFDLYPEVLIDPAVRKAYDEDRQGCIIGEGLAEKYHWKVGDRITLHGTIYQGDYEMNVRGIYRVGKKNVDNGTL